MKYRLMADTRIATSDNFIHIRKGIWNIISGEIDLNVINLQDLDSFKKIMFDLKQGKEVDTSDMSFVSNDTKSLFEQLIHVPFIEEVYSLQDNSQDKLECTLITDSCLSGNIVDELIQNFGLCVKYPTEQQTQFLFQIHNLDRVNYSEYEDTIAQGREIIGVKPVLVLQENLNISLLRLLNRSLLQNVPMFVGFIDGPFLIYTSILGRLSPCFECFEQVMLSKLQDHVLYEKFSKEPFLKRNVKTIKNLSALSFIIYNMFHDVLSFYYSGRPDFCSRVLQIYLPSLEIQYQNLLRIPSCPCCGYTSDVCPIHTTIPLNQLLQEEGGGI